MQHTLRKNAPIILLFILYGFSSKVLSFELLSEGAMGSVSASTNFEVFVNDSASLSVDEDHEKLPFETNVTIEEQDTQEVSVDLNFALVEQVEGWAVKLREKGNTNFEVGAINDLPSAYFDTSKVTLDQGNEQIQSLTAIGGGEDNYQFGRVTQTVNLLKSTKNSASYELESFVERAATLINPFQQQQSLGSTYLSNINSVSIITTTAR